MFKLIIFDVDGVLTDGTKFYGNDGLAHFKRFCDLDFTAIKKFKAKGIPVIWLTGDKFNVAIAEQRKIDCFVTNGKPKSSFVELLSSKYDCKLNEMVYVGDDIFDMDIMELVGKAYCTQESPHIMKKKFTILGHSGQYLASQLYELMFAHDDVDMDKIMELDKNEKY